MMNVQKYATIRQMVEAGVDYDVAIARRWQRLIASAFMVGEAQANGKHEFAQLSLDDLNECLRDLGYPTYAQIFAKCGYQGEQFEMMCH
ncbi:hypothetical protein ACEUZ9_000088 [Paracoccus litorisediminis]|uniref:hypothetical protein n=1 Tax=Paracoccus litorisediminis TaxID=2006130 RepID=UPI00373492A1